MSQRPLLDLNGDGRSDLFWQRASDGAVWAYFLQGGAIAGGGQPVWTAGTTSLGFGDFNGDGRADSLVRDGTSNTLFIGNDGLASPWTGSLGVIDTTWQVVAIGDFNGDLRDDILWQRNDGTLWLYGMNGGAIAYQGGLPNPGAEWRVMGAGDFDGDGKSDLAWRNLSTGDIYLWGMDGTTIAWQGGVGRVGMDWSFAGLGDFNGDGRSDVLWRRQSDGLLWVYGMNGTAISWGGAVSGAGGAAWSVAGIGDYDGNGRADIAFRRGTDGAISLALMNGTATTSLVALGSFGTGWLPLAAGAFQPGAQPVAGSTFTLTTGADRFTGTLADDRFEAFLAQPTPGSAFVPTLQADVDLLDGGAGNDTVFAVVNGGPITPLLRNIETVALQAITAPVTLQLTNTRGVTGVRVEDSTVGVTVTGLAVQSLEVIRSEAVGTALTALMAANPSIRVEGGDNVSLLLTAGGGRATMTLRDALVLMNRDTGALTGIDIVSTGASQLSTNAHIASIWATITLTGSGSFAFSQANFGNRIAGFDSRGFDGPVDLVLLSHGDSATNGSVTVRTGGANDVVAFGGAQNAIIAELGGGDDLLMVIAMGAGRTLTADLGPGNDTIRAPVAALSASSSVAGGEGFDTWQVYGTGAQVASTGFERVALDVLTSGGAVDIGNVSPLTLEEVRLAAFGNYAPITLAGVGANTAIELAGSLGASMTVSRAAAGGTQVVRLVAQDLNTDGYPGVSVNLVLTLGSGLPATLAVQSRAEPEAGLTAHHYGNSLALTTTTSGQNVSIDSDAGLSVSHAGPTLGTVTVTGAGTTSIWTPGTTVINASAATGTLAVVNAGTSSVTGGSAADIVNMSSAGAALTFQGNGGNDTVSLNTGNDRVIFAAASDARISRPDPAATTQTALAGVAGAFETYTNFSVFDRVDLSAFGFGAARQTTRDVSAVVTANTDLFVTIPNLFVTGPGTQAAVAWDLIAAAAAGNPGPGTRIQVFVDVDGDGNFSQATDLTFVVQNTNIGNFTSSLIVWA